MTLTKEQLITVIARREDLETAREIVKNGYCVVHENLAEYIDWLCELDNTYIPSWLSINETETYIRHLRYDDFNEIAFVNAVENEPNEFGNKEEWYNYIHNLCCTSPIVTYYFE